QKERYNSDYVKDYFFVSSSIELAIKCMDKVYNNFYEHKENIRIIEAFLEHIDSVYKDLRSIPREKIPNEKFSFHFKLYECLIELEVVANIYKDKFDEL